MSTAKVGPWTPSEEEELIAAILAGTTHLEAGLRLNRGEGAVAEKVGRLRVQGRLPQSDKCRKWSPERLARLKTLRDQGYSYPVCGQMMGVSASTIEKYARRLGFTGYGTLRNVGGEVKETFWPAEKDERLKSLRNRDLTWPQIAKVMGITYESVQARAKRLGLTGVAPEIFWTEARIQKLIAMRESKASNPEICDTLHCSIGTLKRKITELVKAKRISPVTMKGRTINAELAKRVKNKKANVAAALPAKFWQPRTVDYSDAPRINILDLRPRHCRAPLWHGRKPTVAEMVFCGKVTETEGKPYCEACGSLFYKVAA